jgi:Glycosyltransferase family 92
MVSVVGDMKNAQMRLFISFILLIVFTNGLKQKEDLNEKLSPLYQHLPNCVKGDFVRIIKKTKKKAAVCPMIRDEEGFLSEWVAYYQMHGFDHVFLYNDGSIDKGLTELQPWIDSGFVTVRSNFTALNLNLRNDFSKNAFKLAMTTKALLETDCKLEALKMGYDFQMSLDLDEWVMPRLPGVTIVDEVIS